MWIQNLRIALRNLIKSKGTILINLTGLCTGIAAFILILLWVQDEMSIDRFHEKSDRLFRVMEHQTYSDGFVFTTVNTPGPLAEALKDEVPQIEGATATSRIDEIQIKYEDRIFKERGLFATPDFFEMFSYHVQESIETPLEDPNGILLSETLAEKLFPGQNPLGELVTLDQQHQLRVTGIFRDIPPQSSMQFEYVGAFETYLETHRWATKWGNNGPRTYVTLSAGSDPDAVSADIRDFIQKKNEDSITEMFLFPYSDYYLHGAFENGQQVGGRFDYVRLFGMIGVFILLIACINYINLATARASRRGKEVGVRKVIGASRGSLISLYLGESALVTFLAIVLASGIVLLSLPYFNNLTGKELSLSFSIGTALALGAIFVATAFLAGYYPAFHLSRIKIVDVFNKYIPTSFSEIFTRNSLVIFQFVISIVLIAAVGVVHNQINFIKKRDLGYDRQNLVTLPIEGNLVNELDRFLVEAGRIPGVRQAGSASHALKGHQTSTGNVSWAGKADDDPVSFEWIWVGHDFFSLMDIDILEGREFTRERDLVDSDIPRIMINEKAAQTIGLEKPYVGKRIEIWNTEREIIGVTENIYFESLHHEVRPMFMILEPEYSDYCYFRLLPGRFQETLAALEELHAKVNPGVLFDYQIVEDNVRELYQSEQVVASVTSIFTLLAIVISCLGLLGLTIYSSELRRKEIGIRKILGATRASLVILLSRQHLKQVVIALVVAIPISLLLIREWLGRFAYSTDVRAWHFLMAGLAAFALAWITTALQAYWSSGLDPVKNIRKE